MAPLRWLCGPVGTLLAGLLVLTVACGKPPAEEPQPTTRRVALPDVLDVPTIPLVPIETCGDTGVDFDEWLASFSHYAVTRGVPPAVVSRALEDVAYDPEVIELDRTQRPHKATFDAFAASHVTAARVRRGKQQLVLQRMLLSNIGTRFGVPPEILVAIWGLETDFGAYQGSMHSLRALATLAYDCRRAERFRGELLSALRIVERGDLSPGEMRGAWAGELGQTQFLPSSYEKFGIDFDEDGRIDLVSSVEDALASTANYLAGHGWRRGETYAAPSANFAVLAEWNQSDVYRRTIVLFAQKLLGQAR
jgi:lytic murein transglycosylase